MSFSSNSDDLAPTEISPQQPLSSYPATGNDPPQFIGVRARKPSKDAKVGLKLTTGSEKGSVYISGVDSAGVFAGTPIEVGHKCLSIDGNSCVGKGVSYASALVRNSTDTITFVVENSGGVPGISSTTVTEATEGFTAGVGFTRTDGVLCVASISEESPFAGGLIDVGDECVAINEIKCSEYDGTYLESLTGYTTEPLTIITKKRACNSVRDSIGFCGGAETVPTAPEKVPQRTVTITYSTVTPTTKQASPKTDNFSATSNPMRTSNCAWPSFHMSDPTQKSCCTWLVALVFFLCLGAGIACAWIFAPIESTLEEYLPDFEGNPTSPAPGN